MTGLRNHSYRKWLSKWWLHSTSELQWPSVRTLVIRYLIFVKISGLAAVLMDKLPLYPKFHSGVSEETNCLGCDNFVTGLTNISHLHFSHLMVAKYQTQQDCAYGPISTWHDTTENLCHLSDQSDIINYDKTCQNRFIGITTQPVWNNFLIMT